MSQPNGRRHICDRVRRYGIHRGLSRPENLRRIRRHIRRNGIQAIRRSPQHIAEQLGKLYQENLKDPYHATLLHTYLTTFGLFVSSNESNIPTDKFGRHGGLLSRRSDGRPDVSEEDQASMQAFKKTMELNDPRVLAFFPEADSKWSGSVLTIFPT